MTEKKYDQMLRIRTGGLREWKNEVHYHRYEPTPYVALDELFKVYKLDKTDEVVDFGCGRGRVSFYIHNRFGVPVTGVEVHEKTFEEALENEASYLHRANRIKAPLRFDFGLAEQFEVEETENTFYFFNPFSVQIFKKVVHNILRSAEKQKRTIDIILYYPTAKYKQFIKENTPFKLLNKVRVPGATDKKEKFKIYRLN